MNISNFVRRAPAPPRKDLERQDVPTLRRSRPAGPPRPRLDARNMRATLCACATLALALAPLALPRAAGAPASAGHSLRALRGGADRPLLPGTALAPPLAVPGARGPAVAVRSSADVLRDILVSKARRLRDLIGSAVALVTLFLGLLYFFGRGALLLLVPLLQLGVHHELMFASRGPARPAVRPWMDRHHWLIFLPSALLLDAAALASGSGPLVDPALRRKLEFAAASLGCAAAAAALAVWHALGDASSLTYHVSRVGTALAAQVVLTAPLAAGLACSRFGLFWVAFPALLTAVNEATQKIVDAAAGATPLSRIKPSQSAEGFMAASFATLLVAPPLARAVAGWRWIAREGRGGACALLSAAAAGSAGASADPWSALMCDDPVVIFGGGRVSPLTVHAICIALMTIASVTVGTQSAAAVRRALGRRDFSSPHLVHIPAHGGLIDRFASQIATATGVFMYIRYVAPLVAWPGAP